MGDTRITYKGPPAFASLLVQQLEEQGLSATWTPPMETRGWVVDNVVVPILVAGGMDLLKMAVKEFLKRHPRVEVEIEDDDDEDD